MIVTLDELKAYLRVLHDDEDELITRKIAVAEERIQSHINTNFADLAEPIPASLREAVLMLAGHLYEQRESLGGLSAPWGFYDLLRPYRYGGAVVVEQ